jgi:hypothetical protein
LLAKKVKIDLKNSEGKTALELARTLTIQQKDEVIRLLEGRETTLED